MRNKVRQSFEGNVAAAASITNCHRAHKSATEKRFISEEDLFENEEAILGN